ncbi:MAG: PIG-L family deacetylase [Hydrogenophaga sp.]|nr:PIG-L family deacetylase [Hydrogenophaga sp.]
MAIHVFLFPHQDDEAPVFLEIERLLQTGDPLAIVYLTSGARSGEPELRRTAESLDVLGRLGVPRESIHFIGSEMKVPDGDLMSHLDPLFDWITALIARSGGLASLHMPAWEGGHQDHDAAHLIGVALADKHDALSRSFQFPYYHGRNLPGILFRTLSPLAPNGPVRLDHIGWGQRLRYLGHLTRYRSQLTTWIGLGPFFVLHYLFSGTQVRQPVSAKRVFERPHEGPMLYERRNFSDYKRFQAKADEFRQRHLAQPA